MSAEVLTFPPRLRVVEGDAPPRQHFGLRTPTQLETLAGGVTKAIDIAFGGDAKAAQAAADGVRKRAALEAQRKPPCHTLLLALAGDISGTVERLSTNASIARSYGLTRQAATLVDLASILENVAAEIEAPAHGVDL